MPKTVITEKYEVINRLLEQEFVLVHINTKMAGLNLPTELLSREPFVTLKLSRSFRGAMEVKKTQVTANLLFSGEYFDCKIPFEAIWGMTGADDKSFVWKDEVPVGVKLISEAGVTQSPPEPPTPNGQSSNGKAKLRRIK